MLTNYIVLAEYFSESNIQCKFSKYRFRNSVLTCYIFHDTREIRKSSRMKKYYLLQIVNVENESCNDNTKILNKSFGKLNFLKLMQKC